MRKRIKRRYLILALSALSTLVFAWDFYTFTQRALRHARLALNQADVLLPDPVADEAIVVLTGDTRRIPKGLELLKQRGSRLLLISGAGKSSTLTQMVNQQGQTKVNIHEIWDKILVESDSRSTAENAHVTKRMLKEKNIKRIILTTSDYHMWRAHQIFRFVYPEVEIFEFPVASAVAELIQYPKSSTADASEGVWRLWLEYMKTVLFRFNRVRGAV